MWLSGVVSALCGPCAPRNLSCIFTWRRGARRGRCTVTPRTVASGTPWARGCGGEELAEARAGATGGPGASQSALGGPLGPAGHLPPRCLEGPLLTHRIFCLDPRSECCWVKAQVRSHGSGVTPTHLPADPTGVSLGLFAGTQEVTLTQNTGSDLLPSWGTLQTWGGRGADPWWRQPPPSAGP